MIGMITLKKQDEKTLTLIILNAIIYIAYFLLIKKLYIIIELFVIFICIFLGIKNRKKVVTVFKKFCSDRKRIKNLEYYYITDDNKIIDLEKRKRTYNLFHEMTDNLAIFLILFLGAIFFLTFPFFKKLNCFILIFAILFGLTLFVFYGGAIAGIVYKYTTTIYVLIPVIGGAVYCFGYYIFFNRLVSFLPNFAQFAGYLACVLILYLILAYGFPAHVLRKLNSKTVLISSFTTIFAAFLSQILQFLYLRYYQNGHYPLTIDYIRKTVDLSKSLKKIILDNPSLINIFNSLFLKEASASLSSDINLLVTALTISYIIGALLVNKKIRKNKLKAKHIYRSIIKEKQPRYSDLIKCSFYGGEEYENLLLNNNLTLKVILKSEKGLEIPDVSWRKRFIAWYKKKSIFYQVYQMYQEFLQIYDK